MNPRRFFLVSYILNIDQTNNKLMQFVIRTVLLVFQDENSPLFFLFCFCTALTNLFFFCTAVINLVLSRQVLSNGWLPDLSISYHTMPNVCYAKLSKHCEKKRTCLLYNYTAGLFFICVYLGPPWLHHGS